MATKRAALIKEPEEECVGLYFAKPKKEGVTCIPSGCTLLDCVLGGGWPLGRMSNIIGDKSSGKSLLAIEAATNFHLKWPNRPIYYLEAEAAFDEGYAEALGMPVEAVEFVGDDLPDYTIESWYEHLVFVMKEHAKDKEPILYIVDSLDALSDRAERGRDIDQGSYGAAKPKKVGELFRRLVKEIEKTQMHLMIISQVRDNIGVMFGEKHTRTGGRAMDFYATHCLWLAHVKKLDRTVRKQKRVYGVRIKAQAKKNKLTLPFRECEFPILFGYGVDDITASAEWLDSIGSLDNLEHLVPGYKKPGDFAEKVKAKNKEELRRHKAEIDKLVEEEWQELEEEFLPKSSKY